MRIFYSDFEKYRNKISMIRLKGDKMLCGFVNKFKKRLFYWLLLGVWVSNLIEYRKFMIFVVYIFFNCWLLFIYLWIKFCVLISFLKDVVLNNWYYGNFLNFFWLIFMIMFIVWMKCWVLFFGDKLLKVLRCLLKYMMLIFVIIKIELF